MNSWQMAQGSPKIGAARVSAGKAANAASALLS
eukprot:CAMPEP_0180825926 /NCGR_PEP_ID=MMETSP1038_2-20121128/73242_1 /TAXON_ID=632150 /ORGANISM="Azadinium spinosum, Strain 3D9" /LENGTH=32 /DNA_ID= /DNA_START= /DNA_END= /DNA_ORIENTATION=